MPVPAVQDGICRICHSSTNPGYATCYPCGFDAASIGATEIVPITMSVDRDLVHHHLRGYKDGRSADERERLTTRLAALLAVFLANHAGCLGQWDYAACVPSATRSAVTAIAERTRVLHGTTRATLTARPGNWGRSYSSARFGLTRSITGDRILLLEDTYASGASVHSAAAALRAGGADVIGPLVLGRHVSPAHPPSADMMAWLQNRRWDPERCCRCAGEQRDPGTFGF